MHANGNIFLKISNNVTTKYNMITSPKQLNQLPKTSIPSINNFKNPNYKLVSSLLPNP
jgi:hypothetical protein